MKVTWTGVPGEVRSALEPLVNLWRPIVPEWLGQVSVTFADPEEGDECPMSIEPRPEYRIAYLNVHPWFLRVSPEARRAVVLHEFLHLALEPAGAVFESLLAATTNEDSDLRKWAEEEHRRALEGCVTDLELGLGRLLDPHKDGHE